MGRVPGKVAFVTGIARGQGRSHAVRLAREGADIIGLDACRPSPYVTYDAASDADLEETARLVRDTGRQVRTALIDVRDLKGMTEFVAGAVSELRGLDIVVANAGICTVETWDRVTPEMWQETIDINLTGVWNTIQASAGHLVARGSGSIVITSSAAGLQAPPFLSAYVASKFAVTGLAKALAHELGSHHVRVNSVHPTGVDTPMARSQLLHEYVAASPRLAGAFTNSLPITLIQPEDVSDAVVFLASDEARFITAHALAVDGGLTAL